MLTFIEIQGSSGPQFISLESIVHVDVTAVSKNVAIHFLDGEKVTLKDKEAEKFLEIFKNATKIINGREPSVSLLG
jgi:hypothetical protein